MDVRNQQQSSSTNDAPHLKGKEPFVFATDPNSIKLEGANTAEKLTKIGPLMHKWQTDNSYELQPEDNVARMKLATSNSNNMLKVFGVASLISWVATVGHNKGTFYYPLRAYIIKQICRVRPYRSLNSVAAFSVKVAIFAYGLGYLGSTRYAAYTNTFSQVCTPYGYMMRKLLAQLDDPNHRYSAANLTSQREYDAEFERRVQELLSKPRLATTGAGLDEINHEHDDYQDNHQRTSIPPRYQRRARINRGNYWDDKSHEQQHNNEEEH